MSRAVMEQVRPGNQTDKGLLGSRTDLFHDVGRMPDNSKTRSDFESARGCITQCINESGELARIVIGLVSQPDFFHDVGRTVGSGRIGMTEPKL